MKTCASKWVIVASFLVIVSATPWNNARADPCCIIVVPPPPPPPPKNEPPLNFYGSVYARLPVEAAIKFRLFNDKIKVEVTEKSSRDALRVVSSSKGTLGIVSINVLARYKAETRADVEITGVLVNRPYYSIFTVAAGLKSFSQLKGKSVAVSGELDQLFAAEALLASGVNPNDVNFVRIPPMQRYSAFGKTVDVAAFPLGWESKKLPKYTKIDFPSKGILPAWILFASKQTLDTEIDQVRSLRDGLSKATSMLKSEPAAARPILADTFQIKDKESQDQIINNLRIVLSSSLTPNTRQIENTVKTMRLLKFINRDVELLDSSRTKQ